MCLYGYLLEKLLGMVSTSKGFSTSLRLPSVVFLMVRTIQKLLAYELKDRARINQNAVQVLPVPPQLCFGFDGEQAHSRRLVLSHYGRSYDRSGHRN